MALAKLFGVKDPNSMLRAFLGNHGRVRLDEASKTVPQPPNPEECTHIFLMVLNSNLVDYVAQSDWAALRDEQWYNRRVTHGACIQSYQPWRSPAAWRQEDFRHWIRQPFGTLEAAPLCAPLEPDANYFLRVLVGLHDVSCEAARVHLEPFFPAAWGPSPLPTIRETLETSKTSVTLHWGPHCFERCLASERPWATIRGRKVYGVTMICKPHPLDNGRERVGQLCVCVQAVGDEEEDAGPVPVQRCNFFSEGLDVHPDREFFASCLGYCLSHEGHTVCLSHMAVKGVHVEVDAQVHVSLAPPKHISVTCYVEQSSLFGVDRACLLLSCAVQIEIAKWFNTATVDKTIPLKVDKVSPTVNASWNDLPLGKPTATVDIHIEQPSKMLRDPSRMDLFIDEVD